MKIDKNFKGLINAGWRYEYYGDLISDEGIEINLDKGLYVSGSIEASGYIEAGGYIEASGHIEAGGSIRAGKSIEAGWYIEAGGYIEASGYIEAGWYIRAGKSIEAGGYIEAGGSIEAGGYIKAGGSFGISAGLSITCKGCLKFGLKCFAGVCTWREITEDEKTITCGELQDGTIEYGILVETGLNNGKKKELLSKADELIKKAEELKVEAEKI